MYVFVDTTKLHLSEARQIEFVNRYFREPQERSGEAQGFVRFGRPPPIVSLVSKYLHLDRPMY